MQREFRFSCGLSLIAIVLAATPARAQSALAEGFGAPAAVEEEASTRTTTAVSPLDQIALTERNAGATGERAAERGLLLPYTQSPQISSDTAVAKAAAGYDTAVKAFVARTAAEARILSFLALRAEYEHGPGMGPDDRFGVGARVQLLRQAAHGFDGALGLAYQPNDFRAEGQIVGSVLLGRSFGRLQLFGNVLFGSDPEGDDQALETRASALYRVLRQVHLGLDSRFRFNASEDEKRAGTQTIDWELQATPTASFAVGPIAFLGQAGLSMLQSRGPFGTPQEETLVSTGFVAMAGAGGAF